MTFLVALLLITAEPTPAERIARGRASIDSLDYDNAALELTLAAADPRATEDEKIEANLYAGVANRILGRDTDARLNFVYVLKRRPDTKLPADMPPKIRGFYDLVREDVGASAPPAATPTTTTAPPPTPPSTTPAPAVEPSSGGSPLPAMLVIGGAVVGLAGAVGGVVGSLPYFEHDSARAELDTLAASGADGTAAQARQQDARAAWDSYGFVTTTVGLVAAGVGVVAVGGGAVLWAME